MVALLIVPLVAALICFLLSRFPRLNLAVMLLGNIGPAVIAFYLIDRVYKSSSFFEMDKLFYLDYLSAFHLILLYIVFVVASLFAQIYFRDELKKEELTGREIANFNSLWLLSLAAMTLTLISNNLILIWAGIEATTVFTTFLIALHRTKETLEAMWKYLLICGVGVSFALLGVAFILAAGQKCGGNLNDLMLWTNITHFNMKESLNLLKIGFILIFIGFGTKAGLVPMHTWLPDAHSKAPAPVSAIFSGFMLSLAVYGIIRFSIIVRAYDPNLVSNLFMIFGSVSLVVAAIFIAFQKDIKRLLAYSSIENMGIVVLALGLGPIGSFAALFHTMNHSFCKTLAFISAGRVGQLYGTHEINKITNITKSSWWGVALFTALLALIGMAPFCVFMSKFQVLMALISNSSWILLVVFLAATVFIFIEVLRYLMIMTGGENDKTRANLPILEGIIIICMLAAISVIGFWVPEEIQELLDGATQVINGRL